MDHLQDKSYGLAREEGKTRANREKEREDDKQKIPSYDRKLTNKSLSKFVLRKENAVKLGDSLPKIASTDPFGEGITI